MNLVICGLLTSVAILVCVVYDQTLMFNMMMCIFCLLALVSLWSSESEDKTADKTDAADINSDVTESTKED